LLFRKIFIKYFSPAKIISKIFIKYVASGKMAAVTVLKAKLVEIKMGYKWYFETGHNNEMSPS
jgi:hypothetical protein